MKLDYLLFKKINDLAGQSNVADWMAVFGARYLIVVIAASLLRYIFIYKNKAQKYLNLMVVGNAILAVGLGLFTNFIISLFVQRPRPYELGLGENIYGQAWLADSFPSEHTTMAFALAMAVFLTHRKFGTVLLVLAGVVGLSRIYVGIHYPLDVLVGALIGVCMAYASVKWITPLVFLLKKPPALQARGPERKSKL
ncbi:phosphatase PAP2 family protein [Patescibacteria group bacterium]|nr:phosphatase PAP2 family protein [Patescibacteria group bacterium]MBU1921925.1 phosphatase PAP2 family protein [Patescibacteria group bacterium]